MILEENSKILLQLYEQYFESSGDFVCSKKEVDLMIEEDFINSLENDMRADKICKEFTFVAEVIINVMDNEPAMQFFNLFLNINVREEGVNDVVLLSINDRLMFVKYCDVLERSALEVDMDLDEKTSIQSVLISKGRIMGIKFCNNSLMIIDDFWMLSIYFYCPLGGIIKKKDMPLIGEVTCFRFTKNYLIYSNEHSINFIKFNDPASEPETFEIDLKMIIKFTVIDKFLLAIDKNHFFYYVPIRPPLFIHDRVKKNNEFEEIMDAEIIKFPQVIQHLQSIEKEFKNLSNQIETSKSLNLLLDHLLLHGENFIAGSANIKFLPGVPSKTTINDIICTPTNSKSGHTYIQISVTLQKIIIPFTFIIAFFRKTTSQGTLVRHIEVKNRKKTEFSIFVPAERDDDPKNIMELFVHFNFNSNSDKHVLQFPMPISYVEKNNLYQSVVRTDMNGYVEILANLMKQNNLTK